MFSEPGIGEPEQEPTGAKTELVHKQPAVAFDFKAFSEQIACGSSRHSWLKQQQNAEKDQLIHELHLSLQAVSTAQQKATTAGTQTTRAERAE